MKTAFTVQAKGPDAPMDDRFGRATVYAIIDDDSDDPNYLENPSLSSSSGAGPASVEFLSRHGVRKVVTGNVGPKAARALRAAGITVYRAQRGNLSENLAALQANTLERIDLEQPGSSPDRGPDRARS